MATPHADGNGPLIPRPELTCRLCDKPWRRWPPPACPGRRGGDRAPPDTARRLHAAEQAISSPDPDVRERAIREAAEIVRATRREVAGG